VLRGLKPDIKKRIGIPCGLRKFLESRFSAPQILIDCRAVLQIKRDSAIDLKQRE